MPSLKRFGPPVGTGNDDGLHVRSGNSTPPPFRGNSPAVYRPEVGIGHLRRGEARDARLSMHRTMVVALNRMPESSLWRITSSSVPYSHRTVCCHEIGVERRTAVVSYRRQLGIVAHEEDAAALPAGHIGRGRRAASRFRGRARTAGGGEHGGFVDDENERPFSRLKSSENPRFGVC